MSMTALAEAVNVLKKTVRELEPGLYDVVDASALLDLFVEGERACQAAKTLLASKVDDAQSLAKKTGTSVGKARDVIETGKRLKEAAGTDDAFRRGDLSFEQAAEIAKTEVEVPGSEDTLIQTAAAEDLRTLQDEARRVRQSACDQAELEAKRRRARCLRTWVDDLGMTRISGALLPEFGAKLAARLERATEREWRLGNRECTYEQRTHDAFVELLTAEGKATTDTRVDVVVVADVNALVRGHAEPGEACHIVGGPRISVPTVEELARDAFVTGVVHDGKKINHYKRYGRHISVELRLLLGLGEPPGFRGAKCRKCHKRFRLHIDHRNPRSNRGLTTFENLQFLCPPCHQEKTEEDRRAGLHRGDYGVNESQEACDPDRGPPGALP